MKVLAIEPYYGGSHQAFLDGWRQHSVHDWTLLTLPAHHWKWRMRYGCVHFVQQIKALVSAGQTWDILVCSDMLDLAAFRGLAGPAVNQLPMVVYFHENQLTYPNQQDDPRDLHFAFTNVTTALAADQVWFNSQFHLNDFLAATREFLHHVPNASSGDVVDGIRPKSSVQYPGVAMPADQREGALTAELDESNATTSLHIAWAARWEHDKNPRLFFAALRELRRRQISFQVSVFGQSFREVPPEFQQAELEFLDHIRHWGFTADRSEYLRLLASADVFVSTAEHEFFGIAALEAMSLGVAPVLPDRLSYPELVAGADQPQRWLYDGTVESLVSRLADIASKRSTWLEPTVRLAAHLRSRFSLPTRVQSMDTQLQLVTPTF